MEDAPTRREFVTRAAAGLAAVPLLGTGVAAAAGAPRRRLKKAVKLGMVKVEGSLLDKLKLVKALGYDGVEPGSPNGLDTAELLAARDATGLEIHGVVDSVHWRKPFSHPDEAVRAEGVAALRQAIQDAKDYGASTVLVVPAVVNKTIGYDEAWERSIVEIRKALPDAERAGVKLAFENVWNGFLLSPLEFASYVDAFESPWVGAYFDIGNVIKFGWPEQWIRILGKRILKLDVKGYSHKESFKAAIDEGDCDWAAVREALAAIDYSGWATAEVGGGGEERLRDIAARMDRALGA
ncbi:MAG: sugar phosphate isomerase/epimerase family protein [Planctomycetota bacterium]